jgi:hypothetical protein
LGKLLAEYLISLAAYRLGAPTAPAAWISSLIVSPAISTSLASKGKTRPGRVEPPGFYDKPSSMRIYTNSAHTDNIDIWLSSLY